MSQSKLSYKIYTQHGIKGITFKARVCEGRCYIKSKTFKSQLQAEKWLASLQVSPELIHSHGIESTTMTLGQLCDEFVNVRCTHYRDPAIFRRIQLWRDKFNERLIKDLTKGEIKDFLKSYQNGIALVYCGKNKPLKGKGNRRSPATVNRLRAALNSVLSYAVDEDYLLQNIIKEIKPLRESRGRDRYLLDDERERLLEACKESTWSKLYLLVLMALMTGARRGELLSLRWSDIDFDRQTATLVTSKNEHPRVMPLSKLLVDELSLFREVGNGLIFSSTHSSNVQRAIPRLWKIALEEANVVNFRFHDLRHTAASLLNCI